MITNIIKISEAFAGRLDPQQFHPERMDMLHHIQARTKYCKLKDVVKNVKTTTTVFNSDDIYIGLENITSHTGEYLPTSDKTSISSAAVFVRGNILFPKLRPYLNKVYRAEFDGKCSTEFHVFEAVGIDPNYLTIVLRSDIVLAQTKHLMTGNTLPRLQTSDVENLIIAYPDVAIQQKIVAIYQKAQDAKQANEAEAKALLTSIDEYLLRELGIVVPSSHKREVSFKINISDLFGNRLNPYSYNAKTLTLKNLIISNKLDKVTLSDVITSSIAGDWGIDENDDIDNDTFTKCLVIRATEFDNKYNLNLKNSRVKYRNIKSAKLDKMQINTNDVLIEKSGGSPDQPVGRVAFITDEIVSENICYSNFIHKIKLDAAKINPKYAFYYLSTMYRIGMTESIQSQTNGIRNLIMGNYLKQLIILPKNQNDIVAHIDDIYSKAKILEAQADTLVKDAKEQIEKIILG